ncbi:hypothetical protein A8B75_19450 [Sphingomonadales bacterium EhC05]|nr:hypothetical protein A8B75_19450 [Sphingomonadales bacterium EhC05]
MLNGGIVFKALLQCAAFLAASSSLVAHAQVDGQRALGSFLFDAERCTFGPKIDELFNELQKKHDIRAKEAGFRFETFDNQEEEQFEVSERVGRPDSEFHPSAIKISFAQRTIYFFEEMVPVRKHLESQGTQFGEGGRLADSPASIGDNAILASTDEPEWNEDTGRVEPSFDPRGRSSLSCQLPIFKRWANDSGQSVEEYAQIKKDPGIWNSKAEKLYEKSESARSSGQFREASAASTELVDLLDQKGAEQSIEYSFALDTHAANLAEMGQQNEARDLFARALEISEENLTVEHPHSALILGHYAMVINALGDSEKAWPLINRTLFVNADLLGEKHLHALDARQNLGVVTADLIRRRGDEGGMLSLDDALVETGRVTKDSFKRFGERHPRTIESLLNLAQVVQAMGRLEKAEEAISAALGLSREVLGDTHPDTLKAAADLAENRLRQPSRAAEALGPAWFVISGWFDRRATLLTSPTDEAQRERDAAAQRKDYVRFADAAWSDAKSDPTKIAEASPVILRALQDAMTGSTDRAVALMAARKAAASVGEELGRLAQERQALSDQWRYNEKSLTKAISSSGKFDLQQREELRKQQADIEKRIKSIDSRLRKQAPDYFAFTRSESLNLEDTQTLLASDEAILMVVPSSYGTHVVAVTDKNIEWQRSDWNAEQVNAAVKRLLWDVGANVDVDLGQAAEWADEGEGAYPFDRGTAYELYGQIVAPVGGLLSGKRHVFIAANGALSSLPFTLLVTEKPTGPDGDPETLRNTKWFADAHALVQIPSLQSLQFLRQSRSSTKEISAAKGFAGFGDPALDGLAFTRGGGGRDRTRGGGTRVAGYFREGQNVNGTGIVDVDALKALARLPGTAQEIMALEQIFGPSNSQTFLGKDATENKLRNLDLSNIRILALATHGLVAGELDGRSEGGLVFTPPNVATSYDDGLLTTSEVATLDLNAEWVILSACNTAAGDGSEGAPGLSGLARSFFYAGARNLLASHWPVRDDVAAKITVRTVEIGRTNPLFSRAEAFQVAIREIRNSASHDSDTDTFAHPNAWAPFTLIGDR